MNRIRINKKDRDPECCLWKMIRSPRIPPNGLLVPCHTKDDSIFAQLDASKQDSSICPINIKKSLETPRLDLS